MYSDRSGHTKDVIPYKATVLCSLLPLANRSRPAAFDKVTSQPADIRIAAAWKLRLSKLIIRGVAPILPKSDCHLLFGMRGVVRETHLRIELKKGRHRKLGSWIDTYVRCIYLYTCIYIYVSVCICIHITHTSCEFYFHTYYALGNSQSLRGGNKYYALFQPISTTISTTSSVTRKSTFAIGV